MTNKQLESIGVRPNEDHLVFLDMMNGEIRSMAISSGEQKLLVPKSPLMPDGLQIAQDGTIYFTRMGHKGTENDGSIAKATPNPSAHNDGLLSVTDIVAPGLTHTPKQIQLDSKNSKLYWCDREGGRIQRSNLDGSELETLYDSAPGKPRPLADARDWCVGITIDYANQLVYWTQKGPSKGSGGKILRANLHLPAGQKPEARKDIEVLFDNLPEPVDIELDDENQVIYWTDRGDPPLGNSLNRSKVTLPLDPSRKPDGPDAKLIVIDHLHEAIGLTLDPKTRKVYVADLMGSIYETDYEGKTKRTLVVDKGNYSGITFVRGAN